MAPERTPGNDAASRLEEIFDAHARRVLAYALRRTASAPDAEDVVAETFAIAWRKVGQIPDDALPWLLSVARRVIANQRRGRQRREWLLLKLRRQPTAEQSRSPDLEGADGPALAALAALAQLRPDDQDLLRLVAWDDLDQRQIGQVLGISANAVAIRLYRARRRFRDELVKDPGLSRTSGEVKGAVNGAMQERVE